MPLTFGFKPIGDPKFNLKGITKDLQAAVIHEGWEQTRLLDKTTRTWKKRPVFMPTVKVGPSQVTLAIEVKGHGADIWGYLEDGTKIRWAVMGGKFKPKTRRAFLGSSKGRGGPVIVGKRAMMARGIRPRPGIKARNWTAEVNKERSRKFKGLMQRVFDQIARNTITPGSLRKP
jgi:hypothetical protein